MANICNVQVYIIQGLFICGYYFVVCVPHHPENDHHWNMKVSVTQHDTHCGLQPNKVVDVVTFYQARSDILSAGKQGRVNQCCAVI